MSTRDGQVRGSVQVVSNGDPRRRWNLVVLGDGYRADEMERYRGDVDSFVAHLRGSAPFGDLWRGINVFRVDVSSTDSGADDPTGCGGSGARARTYFDATFCKNGIRRLLVVDSTLAIRTATRQVRQMHATVVIVNSAVYGGSGGSVAVFSTAEHAFEIGLHELGHSSFGLADEYQTYAGCESGETGRDTYRGGEPRQPNITREWRGDRIKWRSLVTPGAPMPTMLNPDCTRCDGRPSPVAAGTVGAFSGAGYFHCGLYRPEYECKMRTLGQPFCAVCQAAIRKVMSPFLR